MTQAYINFKCVFIRVISNRSLFSCFINMALKIVFCGILLLIVPISTYKPVVLIHGVMTGSASMEMIKFRIEEVRAFCQLFLSYYFSLNAGEVDSPSTILCNDDYCYDAYIANCLGEKLQFNYFALLIIYSLNVSRGCRITSANV